jgi:hypothetical protein
LRCKFEVEQPGFQAVGKVSAYVMQLAHRPLDCLLNRLPDDGWKKNANFPYLSAHSGLSLGVYAYRSPASLENENVKVPGTRDTGIASGLAVPPLTP